MESSTIHKRTLQGAIALQCLGEAQLVHQRGGPLSSFFFLKLELPETICKGFDSLAAVLLLSFGLLVLINPKRALLRLLFGWFAAAAVMKAIMGGEFGAQLGPLTGALRYLGPCALIAAFDRKTKLTWRLLAWGTIAVFVAHGIEALLMNPKFIDYLIVSADRVLAMRMSQATAQRVLLLIGGLDILVALLLLTKPSRALLVYMAFWGLLTASMRLIYFGPSLGYPHTLVRALNGFAPLILLLMWRERGRLFLGVRPLRLEPALGMILMLIPGVARAQAGEVPPEGTQPAQLRVIWHEDPAHSAVVAWSSEQDGSSVLHLDTTPHGEDTAAYAQHIRCDTDRYSLLSSLRYHHCPLQGLKPSTTYYLVAQTDGDRSQPLHFVTAPDDGRPFKLLFGGDSRTDRDQRRAMNQLLRSVFEEDEEILALAHGGDYIENGLSMGQWSDWLTDHELTTTGAGRLLPVIPARGNHEAVGPIYGRVWASPQGDYFTTIINDFWLITLNSETSMTGDQLDWLQGQLMQGSGQACFVTAQYHRPAFPAVKEPGDALMHWVPHFEQHDVDLVFESDGHALKRTFPIRGGQADPSGVTYVGEGGLGVAQRTPETDRWYLDFAASQHHLMRLAVERRTMRYEAISPEGVVVDSASFQSKRCVGSLQLESPQAGEMHTGGTALELVWLSEDIDRVDLDYSLDDGQSWAPIAQATESTGSYLWTLPLVQSTDAQVRIREVGGALQAYSERFAIVLPEPPPPPNEMPMEQPEPSDEVPAAPPKPQEPQMQAPLPEPGGGCTATSFQRDDVFALGILIVLLGIRRERT